jgi:hypothetical protein
MPQVTSLPLEAQLPDWVLPRWQALAKAQGLALSARLNPFLQRGDFDGDGKPDIAVFVEQTKSHALGIAIFHRSGAKPMLLGAGIEFGNGGASFDWLDIWKVQEKKGSRPEALLLLKESSVSALVYFEKGKYHWLSQGD